MTRDILGPIVVLCGAGALAACSGDDSSNPMAGAPDATAEATATAEASAPDAREAAADAATADVVDATTTDAASLEGAAESAAETGGSDTGAEASEAGSDGAATGPQLLQAGANLSVQGVTEDDYVLYLDNSTSTFYGMSVHGGTPTPILTVPSGEYAFAAIDGISPAGFMFGKLVFIYTLSYSPIQVTSLTLWGSALSTPALITTAGLIEYGQTVWPSNDSKYFIYTRVTSSDATVGAIYGVNADGTNQTLLVQDVALQPTNCVATVTYAGQYAVVSYCPSADAGSAVVQNGHTVQAFSVGGSWTPALSVADAFASFAVDPNGTQVIAAPLVGDAGSLQVFPIDGGGGGVALDPGTPITRLTLVPGSTYPWYVAYAHQGTIRQASVSPPSSQTLVDGGANFFDTASADGKWMVVSSRVVSSGYRSDLAVASTATPGALETLVAIDGGTMTVYTAGGAFTTDDQYMIYVTNIVQSAEGSALFNVSSAQLASPNALKSLSSGQVVNFMKLGGSRLLLLDDFRDTDGGAMPPTADLVVVDPSSAHGPVTIASGVPVSFDTGNAARNVAVTSDGTRVLYGVTTGNAPGIYVAAVP